jgi:hypothetical protein
MCGMPLLHLELSGDFYDKPPEVIEVVRRRYIRVEQEGTRVDAWVHPRFTPSSPQEQAYERCAATLQ